VNPFTRVVHAIAGIKIPVRKPQETRKETPVEAITPQMIGKPSVKAEQPVPVEQPKVWLIDGKMTTDKAAASAEADADQKAKDAAAVVEPKPVAEPIQAPEAKQTALPSPIVTVAGPPVSSHGAITFSTPAAPVAQPTPAKNAEEPVMATSPVTPAPKETVAQDIGNFFKKLLVDVDKGFAFVDKIAVAAQPVVQAVDAAIAPIDGPLAAAIAAGDGLINGVISVTGSVLNTITAVGATNATPAQKMAAALPAIEQEILSDPTLAGAVKAVGGTPTNIAQFNTNLTAAAQALYLLTTAI
jgi:hypothetical protein